MTYVVVGATAGLGRALSERLAASGHPLVLAASDQRDLNVVAAHLRLQHGIEVETVAFDGTAEPPIEEIREAVGDSPIAAVLMPIGVSSAADDGTLVGDPLRRLLKVNFTLVAELSAALLPDLLTQGFGSIVGFGSVAAVRGRTRNVAYAAAKRGLRSYFESLVCVTHSSPVEVQFYELGYIATQQAFGKRLVPRPVPPERVADIVARNLGRGSFIRRYPPYWNAAAVAIRLLPATVFRRLGA
ncbi:MAG: hypothetical protein QOG50_2705 [Actinomycetota bacterium]|nr:hypothetical protein [Actinomycetota bacterium]